MTFLRRHIRGTASIAALIAGLALAIPLLLAHADPGFDSTLFGYTNGDRSNPCGRPQLGWSDSMAAIAQQRAEYIADTGDLVNHLEPGVGAENTGQTWNVPDAATAAGYVNTAYMNSGVHRANICDGRWNVVGIASVYRDTWQGHSQVWINAEEFASGSSAPPSSGNAPPQASSAPSDTSGDNGGDITVPGTGGSR